MGFNGGLPSGNLLRSYWKWLSRNSGFSHWKLSFIVSFPIKNGDFPIHIIYRWVCLKMLCTPLYPMVLLIIIPMKNGYFIGNIPYFQTNPYRKKNNMKDVDCFSTSKHQRSLVGGLEPWNLMFHVINMGCHPKPMDELTFFHFFSRWLRPPTRICILMHSHATGPSGSPDLRGRGAGTALELASGSVKYGLKRWMFCPKTSGRVWRILRIMNFPRS